MITVVAFTKNNAKVLKMSSKQDLKLLSVPFVLNPSLEEVRGIPPHFWKIKNNQIVPMNEVEQLQRARSIAKEGIDNNVYLSKKKINHCHRFLKILNFVLNSMIVLAAIVVVFAAVKYLAPEIQEFLSVWTNGR